MSGDCKRKALSIQEKLEIIKRFESNERTCDIVRATGIKESTLRTIRNNAAKLKRSSIAGTIPTTALGIRIRPREMEEMEKLLSLWIEGHGKKRSGIKFPVIKQKALSIYSDLKKQSINPAEVVPFSASTGWFNGFKHRHNFHNIQLTSEAASADEQAAKEFLPVIETLIEDEGYSSDQIFNFDETTLYIKCMPSTLEFKTAKDHLSVMLGTNASGDFKLKPLVIYHSAKPLALRGIVKNSLGVYYRHNKKGWMTAQVCLDIFADVYILDIEDYCKKKNIAFKVLIIMDTIPSHPLMIANLNPNVKFVFLPSKTASFIQPLDQGVITVFKAYYLKRTFKMLIDAREEENTEAVIEFWKRYNIKMAIDNIVGAWNDVSKLSLHHAWHKLIPNLIQDFEGFELSCQIKKVTASCVQLAKQAGFRKVKYKDVEKLLEDQLDFTTEELQELVAADEKGEVENEDDGDDQKAPLRQLNTAQLSNVLSMIEKQLQWIEDNDYNAERSRKAVHGIRANLEPYKQLLYERRTLEKQQMLGFCFNPIKTMHEEEGPEVWPSTFDFVTFDLKVKVEGDGNPPSPASQ